MHTIEFYLLRARSLTLAHLMSISYPCSIDNSERYVTLQILHTDFNRNDTWPLCESWMELYRSTTIYFGKSYINPAATGNIFGPGSCLPSKSELVLHVRCAKRAT
jgi:hypothetical protein